MTQLVCPNCESNRINIEWQTGLHCDNCRYECSIQETLEYSSVGARLKRLEGLLKSIQPII